MLCVIMLDLQVISRDALLSTMCCGQSLQNILQPQGPLDAENVIIRPQSSSWFSHLSRFTGSRLRILVLLPTNRDHIIPSLACGHNHTKLVGGGR